MPIAPEHQYTRGVWWGESPWSYKHNGYHADTAEAADMDGYVYTFFEDGGGGWFYSDDGPRSIRLAVQELGR